MALEIAITPSPIERSYAVSESATTKIFIAYVLPASLLAAQGYVTSIYTYSDYSDIQCTHRANRTSLWSSKILAIRLGLRLDLQ